MTGTLRRGRLRSVPLTAAIKRRLMRPALRVAVSLPYPLRRNPLFDADWYRQRHRDVAESGMDPWRHYVRHGAAEGRNPNELFDTRWYRERYPDVASERVDPLGHYLTKGAWEGRDPSPAFSSSRYLAANPDVRRSGMNPLVHYLRHGAREGRHALGQEVPLARRTQPNAPARGLVPAQTFESFEEYLRLAITNPNLLRSPYSEQARRVLDYMGWLRDRLAADHADAPQDDLVSVVIPTYQRADMVGRAIASVTQQTYRNLEIIVVDDGSTDGTEEVIAGLDDSRIRYIRSSQNMGSAPARNLGLDAANGSWIAHLDSDDWWDPDFVLISLNEARQKGFHFAYSAQLVLRPAGSTGAERPATIRYAPFNRSLLENTNYISTIAVIHTRELIERVGMFDTSLRRFIDWDLFLRMSARSSPLAIPVVLSTYDQPADRRSVSLDEARERNLSAIDQRLRDVEKQRIASHRAGIPSGPGSGLGHGTSVIIPNFEALRHLRRCVDSVQRFTPQAETIIVDNHSGPASRRYLEGLRGSGIRVLFNEANLGFSHAVNQGLELAAPSNDVVLLNNDASVTPGWLAALRDVLQRHADVGIVAPRQVLRGGEPTIRTHVPGADPARECDCNLSAHHRNVLDPSFEPHTGLVELTFAPFFCVLIRREVIDRIGPLDHVRAPHYRSDRLYCEQVRTFGGYRIVYTPHSIVHHAHQRATSDLADKDPKLYTVMKDANDWHAVRAIQGLEPQQPRAD